MKKRIAITAAMIGIPAAVLSIPVSVSASPYVGTDLTVEIAGHRWGIWTLSDTPSHDTTSPAYRDTKWLSTGHDDEDDQTFYSYLIIGLGPYGAVYLSFRLCLIVLFLIIVGAGGVLWRKTRLRRNLENRLRPGHAA